MLGKTVLLYTNDRGAARRLTGHLRGAGNDVVVPGTPAAAADLALARAVDLVVVDGDDTAAAGEILDAVRGTIPAVVVSARAEPRAMLDFVCARGVEHVLAHADEGGSLEDLAREVVVTAEKILCGDLFGLDKYLPAFGVELSTAEVRGALDRDGVVECIGDHVEWLGAGREARRAVAAIADELITNAVYDAPRDAAGNARYHSVDRRQKVQLDPWEYVTVRWASDGDLLALSVTDWFGALRREHIRDGVHRCLTADDPIEQKAGGAGLGFYTALSYSTQLVVNVDRGSRTEIISLVDLRRRSAAVRRAGRSLHLFFDDSAARTHALDAVPSSVVVSESLRLELREQLAPAKKRTEIVPLVHAKKRARRATMPRARGSEPPIPAGPSTDPIGAHTACGLLRGVREPDTALRVGLRFLAQHYEVAVAYAVDGRRLVPVSFEGAVHDWARLRELRIGSDGTASVAALARGPFAVEFRPRSPLDLKIALLATGDSEAPGITVPLHVDGDLRWILYAAMPRGEAPITHATVEGVRAELERSLCRLDPTAAVIEIAR